MNLDMQRRVRMYVAVAKAEERKKCNVMRQTKVQRQAQNHPPSSTSPPPPPPFQKKKKQQTDIMRFVFTVHGSLCIEIGHLNFAAPTAHDPNHSHELTQTDV